MSFSRNSRHRGEFTLLTFWGDITAILRLDSNNLTGTIPPRLFNLTNLLDLSLNNNALNGTIPGAIGSLTKLTALRLDFTNIGGSLPSELFNLIELSELNLQHASFVGPLDASFSKLVNLAELYLNNNSFTGNVPTAFNYLTKLRKFMNFFERKNISAGLTMTFRKMNSFLMAMTWGEISRMSFATERDRYYTSYRTLPPTVTEAHLKCIVLPLVVIVFYNTS